MSETFAPSGEQIEALTRAALAKLPDPFAAHLTDIVVRIEEWPEDTVLDELGIEDPIELTGLYSGRPIGEKSSFETGAMPDMIQLFRMPILYEWAETGVGLETLITHILVHEVGHHFGLSDADMHALEDSAG